MKRPELGKTSGLFLYRVGQGSSLHLCRTDWMTVDAPAYPPLRAGSRPFRSPDADEHPLPSTLVGCFKARSSQEYLQTDPRSATFYAYKLPTFRLSSAQSSLKLQLFSALFVVVSSGPRPLRSRRGWET